MKRVPAYTISHGSASRGIATRAVEGRRVVDVGEEGRGRWHVAVPVPAGAVLDEAGRLLEAPTSYADVVAVILIRDHSGVRGGWHLAPEAERFCPRSPEGLREQGREWVRQPGAFCAECGGGAGYFNHRLLPDQVLKPSAIGYLIAEGACAQGDAGRMGGGPEYLIACRPGAFSIRASGRLYGAPAAMNVIVHQDGTVTIADALDALRSQAAAQAW